MQRQLAMTNRGSTNHSDTTQYRFAFVVMTSLFFIWGFITALNDILIPHLKAAFDLSYTQAMLVQFCFFGAYFIVSPIAGKIIQKVGYLKGIVIGLLTISAGCLLFYPAAQLHTYGFFLLGLFVLASGITLLQVSANPYVASLGHDDTATSRLNLAQAVNSLGHTLGPVFGSALIFGAAHSLNTAPNAEAVQEPYLILAGITAFVALGFTFLKLPHLATITAPQCFDAMHSHTSSKTQSIWQQKRLALGVVAIFLYVGAEVSIGSFLVNYFTQSHIGNLTVKQAGDMVSYYWGAAMIGRFIGAYLSRIIRPSILLAGNGGLAILLLIVTLTSGGDLAMWSVIGVGLFNSIMFPTIFTLAIKGLGPLTAKGSGLLCQAIVGGALLPLIQGFVADISSIQASFVVPIFAYLYICFYAIYCSKNKTPATHSEAIP